MKTPINSIHLSITIIAMVLVTNFFKEFNSLVPILLGVVSGLIFAPLLVFLQGKKIHMVLIIIFILILFLSACIFFSTILLNSIENIIDNFDRYQERLYTLIHLLEEKLDTIDENLIIKLENYLFAYLEENILSYSKSIFQSIGNFGSQYLIVAITMVFVLIERATLHLKIAKLYENSEKKGAKLIRLIDDINVQISKFLLLKAIISAITAIVVYIGFGFIGVDFKFIWALLTFFFNFIPTIGSIIITLLSVLFSIIQFFPSWPPILAVIILTLSIQMIIGNFLDPKIMGDRLNLSPLIIWISLIYWGWVWGIIGALLAIPLTVTIRIICEYIPHLHQVGLFLGNVRGYK